MKRAILAAMLIGMGAFAKKAYLANGGVRLGVDLERGGTICFLSTRSGVTPVAACTPPGLTRKKITW